MRQAPWNKPTWRKRIALWSAGAAAGLALAAGITFARPTTGEVASDPGAGAALAPPEPASAAPAPGLRQAVLDASVAALAEAAPEPEPAAPLAAVEPQPTAPPEPDLAAAIPAPPPQPAAPAAAAQPEAPAPQPPAAAAEPPSAQEYKPNFYLPEAPSGGLTGPEQRFFDGLNAERAKTGLAPYSLDASLSHVARIRSRQLADQGYFGHTDPFGYSMYVELLGYFGIGYAWAGENLAMNNYDLAIAAERAVISLMNSATHRANILDADFRRIGVGEFTALDGKHYYATVFVG